MNGEHDGEEEASEQRNRHYELDDSPERCSHRVLRSGEREARESSERGGDQAALVAKAVRERSYLVTAPGGPVEIEGQLLFNQ